MYGAKSAISGYTGRFAPSPTGPLHFGSLIAAAGSFLRARSRGGKWLVRIEDLDPPREQPGAGAHILHTLAAYGLQWDGEVMVQSRRTPAYNDALARLVGAGRAYYCDCTRKQVELNGRIGAFGPVYSGTCRERKLSAGQRRSLRLVTHDKPVGCDDKLQGHYSQHLKSEIGDFVVRRADGLISYHLAVVVDDAAQGVTEIVRGADLLDSTPRQIYLQQLLRLPTPDYLHLPIAVDAHGAKLSKQTRAKAISLTDRIPTAVATLRFLNHEPPASVQTGGLDAIWRWAIEHWSPARLPRARAIVPGKHRRLR